MKRIFAVFMIAFMIFTSMSFTVVLSDSSSDELCHDFTLGFPDTQFYVREGTTEEVYEDYRAWLPEEMAVFDPYEVKGKIQIFVATDGNDFNNGTIDKPLKTLEAAVERLKQHRDRSKGAVIYLREGNYSISSPVTITELLSGNDEYPVFISSYNDEKVRLYSAVTANRKSVSVNQLANANGRINSNARSKIRAIDCSGLNIDYTISSTSEPQAMINGMPYNVARWPNTGYANFAKYDGDDGENGVVSSGGVVNKATSQTFKIDNDYSPFEFKVASYRPTTWENTGEIWMNGRMNTEYKWERFNIDSINADIPSIRSKTVAWEGCAYSGHNIFYCYNIIEELDNPGEYFYDKNTEILYFYPLEDYDDSYEMEVLIPTGIDKIIDIDGANNIVINGIEFGYSNVGVYVMGRKNVIQNCTFVNSGDFAIRLLGPNNGVIYSKFLNNQNTIYVNPLQYDGTKTPLLGSGNGVEFTRNFVQNNYFQNGTLDVLSTVQAVISHNYFGANTRISSRVSQRQNVIEYNKFISPLLKISDGAASYNTGEWANSNLTFRNNYVRRYVSEEGTESQIGFYMDDLSCTSMAYNNIFVDCRAYYHGGSDHIADNNIFIGIDTKDFISYINSENYYYGGYLNNIMETYITSEPSSSRGESNSRSMRSEYNQKWDYRLNELVSNFREVRSERSRYGENYVPGEAETYIRTAKNNVLKNSLFINCSMVEMQKNAVDSKYENNLVINKDPGFESFENYDFDLKEDSEVFEKIKGFKKLPPMDSMGIVFGKGQFKEKFEIDTPKLYSPANTTDTVVSAATVKLDWADVFGVSEYRLVVSNNADLSDPVIDKKIIASSSEYELSKLKYDKTYYWQVEATANDESFTVRNKKSDIYTFKTCREKDMYLFEEVDTGLIKDTVSNIKASMEYIVEDNGEDRGYGVYKQGTLKLLDNAVAEAESKLESYKLNSEVKKDAKKLSDTYVRIITENAIPYTRKVGGFNEENWLDSSGNARVTFAADGNSVKLEPKEGSTILSDNRPLTPKEAVEFKMKYESLGGGWPSISTKILTPKAGSPYGQAGYYIAFSGNNIELQKTNAIVYSIERKDLIPINKWFDAYMLTEITDDGNVRIVFKVDGNTIIDYVDKESPVTDIGYYGFKIGNNEPITEISVP